MVTEEEPAWTEMLDCALLPMTDSEKEERYRKVMKFMRQGGVEGPYFRVKRPGRTSRRKEGGGTQEIITLVH